MVLGIRGMPNVQGGVETHAENLYERLAALGCEIEALVRSPFVPPSRTTMGPIRLKRIWSPRTPGLEALLHSLLGVVYAALVRPDILHIHAVGPAIVVPLARLFGLKVIVTHHGPDYDRDKWGWFARSVLRTGERFGMKFSQARIAISQVIVDLIRSKYGETAELIPNGVKPVTPRAEAQHVLRFGLEPGRYVLQVSRLVPEKRQLDLIRAFAAARLPGWKLALVGGLDSSAYCAEVQAAAQANQTVLTGFQNGIALEQLYSHAGMFVLPSSHEGLPIAMLEALSYGLPVIASDIPANLEVGLGPTHYFSLGDSQALAQRLGDFARAPQSDALRAARRAQVTAQYDWRIVAEKTLELYRRTLQSRPTHGG